MTAFVAAGGGFLLAVLWFDLMFDVQTLRHRREAILPEDVLASIAGYYRRVTTEAFPMNRLVALVMAATVVAIVRELIDGDVSRSASAVSLVLAVGAIALAGTRTVPNAVRLGRREDTLPFQSQLARTTCRDHVACFAAIATLVAIQLSVS
jgi:hypothetical protein